MSAKDRHSMIIMFHSNPRPRLFKLLIYGKEKLHKELDHHGLLIY